MPTQINQEFPIQFPRDMYQTLSGLGERGLMTPTYLSRLLMSQVILPAQSMVEKKMPLAKAPILGSWIARSSSVWGPLYSYDDIDRTHQKMCSTHEVSSLSVDGLETLEAKLLKKSADQEYEIFCCGNAQDAMDYYMVVDRILSDPSKNYIFWNYPGVGSSKGKAHCAQDLFKAGYQQAKRLINQGICAQNITLHGYSLGGGVAIRVARQLHEEGHLVNLEVDRSFARLASVVPALFTRIMTNEYSSKQSSYAPLITSTIALALSGAALGTTFSGFVASVGLVAASATAVMGYIGAFFIQSVGFLLQKVICVIGELIAVPCSFFSKSISDDIKSLFKKIGYGFAYSFNLVAFAVNETGSTLASFIDNAVNLIGSIAGASIAVGGLVAGGLVGLLFGAILSTQLLWTEKPLTMPMTPAFSAALYSLCCDMDSVSSMQRLLNANHSHKAPKISVVNASYDEVIDVEASLLVGLGLRPPEEPSSSVRRSEEPSSSDTTRRLQEKGKFFWHPGGHYGSLGDPTPPIPNGF